MILRKARNVIAANQEAGVYFPLFLANREGSFFQARRPGVKLTSRNLHKITDLVRLPPDGNNKDIFEAFLSAPETFDTPLLVQTKKKMADGQWRSFVMLYIKAKQNMVEQVF